METRVYISAKIQKNHKKTSLNRFPGKDEMLEHLNSWNANYVALYGKRC